MTRIDFYLLDGSSRRRSTSSLPGVVDSTSAGGDGAAASKDMAVCQLTNKAFLLGHRIYIHTADAVEAQRLDNLLWTFAAGSFIPHAITHDADANTPVIIGQDAPSEAFDDVLISLAPQVPECFSRFQRVAEVVGPGDAEKQQARERFRFYRDRGYELQTHNL